jgi:uncharacterized protein (UPF0248 family)
VARRKGELEEVLSLALHADDPDRYVIVFRDMNSLVEMKLRAFLEESGRFTKVPASRIVEVRRDGVVVFRRAAPGGRPRSCRAARCPSAPGASP